LINKEITVVTRINLRLIATLVVSLFLTTSALAQTSKGFFVGNIIDPNKGGTNGVNKHFSW